MTTKELRQLFVKNEGTESLGMLSDLIDITKHVNMKTEMTDDEMGYVFRIDLVELSKSNIDDDTIYKMVDNGWVLSKDNKSLVKRC